MVALMCQYTPHYLIDVVVFDVLIDTHPLFDVTSAALSNCYRYSPLVLCTHACPRVPDTPCCYSCLGQTVYTQLG